MIIVADNIRITDQIIADAISQMNPVPIQKIVMECEKAGAQVIDVNSGPLSRTPEKQMVFLIDAIQEVSKLPLIVDTANPKAMEAGIRACKNKAIVNGFSLEPAKLDKILPLAKKYQTDIIGYLLYPNGHVPPDGDKRLEIAIELFEQFKKHGIDENRLIIDPIIAPLSWQSGKFQAKEILYVIKHLPEIFGFPVRTIAGLSNLTTGRGHKAQKLIMERTYLSMLASAGLSMIMMNVLHNDSIKTVRACNLLIDEKIFAWEEMD
ncbi:MAG: dihydropteroate synthase [Pseudomonadota bacterium]